jgi:hypothetical protein
MDTGPMGSGWFYSKPSAPEARQVGPLTWEELWQLARLELLEPYDMVWHETLAAWVPAGQIAGLFAVPPVARPASRRRRVLAWVLPLAAVLCIGVFLALLFSLRGGESGPNSWLVMIYSDADDEILEEDMVFDVNEAELTGSTDEVRVVVQLDRYAGGYAGDGDWTTARRYLLREDTDLYRLNSELVADLGEVDMGDPTTLYDFATWAISTYPSEHYALILSDHGAGWAGGWSDSSPSNPLGMSVQDIDGALGAIVADTGIGALDLVGLDACLMAQLEVMSALAPHALYAVASEETEPSLGWGYAAFLGELNDDPSMTGRGLGEAIVDTYIEGDVRITDEGARTLLAGAGSSAEGVVQQLGLTSTLSAVDLSAIQDLDAAVNELAVALVGIDQGLVAQARAYSQSYSSVFSDQGVPSFIDLGHFADLLLAEVDDPAVVVAARQVRDALSRAVVAEKHGDQRPGSNGLTIYFPNSEEYSGTFGGWSVYYPSSIGRFATASLWDDYLTSHYTGAPLDPTVADLSVVTPALAGLTDFTTAVRESAPAAGAEVVGPGAGAVTLAPITVSAAEVGPEETVTLSSQISGSNIGYVYYYVSYYWESDGSFLSADAGYVEPGYVRERDGVYYPDWGDEAVIDVEYEWRPVLFYMSDGNHTSDQFAYFQPTGYGADFAGDIYSVWGTYAFVDTGTVIDAVIDFSGEGDMLRVWGYGGGDSPSSTATWHELTPRPGDVFTITAEFLEFGGDPAGEFVDYPGGQMTFGETPFTMVPYYAFPGDYRIGIGVEDLDGNITWQFADVTVTE